MITYTVFWNDGTKMTVKGSTIKDALRKSNCPKNKLTTYIFSEKGYGKDWKFIKGRGWIQSV